MRFRNIRKHNNKSAIAAAKATRRGSPKTNYFSETTIFGTSLNLVLTKVVWLPPIAQALQAPAARGRGHLAHPRK